MGDLFYFFFWYYQVQLLFYYVEYFVIGVWEVFQILSGNLELGFEFVLYFGDFYYVMGQQWIGGDDVIFVGDYQCGVIIVLVLFYQVVNVVYYGQVGDGQLIFVVFVCQYVYFEDGDIGFWLGLFWLVKEVFCQF